MIRRVVNEEEQKENQIMVSKILKANLMMKIGNVIHGVTIKLQMKKFV